MKPTQGPSIGQILIYDITSQRFGIFSLFLGIPSLGLLVYGLLSKSYEYALIGLVGLLIALFEVARLLWRFRSFQKIYENGEAVRMILKGVSRTGDEISFGGVYIHHNRVYGFSTTIQKNKRTRSLAEDDQIFLVIDRDKPRQAYIQDLYTPDSPEDIRQPIDKTLESELLRTPEANDEFSMKERIHEGSQRFIWVGLFGLLLLFGAFIGFYFGYQQQSEVKRIAGAQTTPQWVTTGTEGIDLLLTGTLDGQIPAGTKRLDDEARHMGLVIYAVEEWHVSSDEDTSSWWETDHLVIPTEVTLGGKVIALQASGQVELEGKQVVSVQGLAGNGATEENIPDGTLRLVGYLTGSQMTIFGKRGTGDVLVVERVFGGTREEFLAYLRENSSSTVVFGWVLLALGILLLGVFLFLRRRLIARAQ